MLLDGIRWALALGKTKVLSAKHRFIGGLEKMLGATDFTMTYPESLGIGHIERSNDLCVSDKMATVYYVDFNKRKLLSREEAEQKISASKSDLEKMSYFSSLLNQGMSTIRVNTKWPGVVLPSHLKDQLITQINWSTKFQIPDFQYDELGVRGTLSFNKTPCYTDIPWAAVWSMALAHGGSSREWKESIPKEIYFTDE
jgi:hypothetical protein